MDSTNPTLSIVVISYNTWEMTTECLESVYQNPPRSNFEVILVDNDSVDKSVELVKKNFPQVTVIENKDNRGFARANNQAFKICKGNFVLLLNSDTIVLEDVLQKSIDFMEENPNAGAMGCRVLNTDRTTQYTCSMFPSNLNLLLKTVGLDRLPGPKFFDRYQMLTWPRDTLKAVDIISGCYLMTRLSVLEEIGYLDEDFFFFGEETEWCDRLKKSGQELYFAPIGEIIHHGGGSVKKLKHTRDVMLTRATILIHLKARSFLSALLCFLTLFAFNASRAAFWGLRGIVFPKDRERAGHFYRVVSETMSTWPSKENL